MSQNTKLMDKVQHLRKEVDKSCTISTFAELVSWEESNSGSNKRPRIAKPLLKQLQSAGLYLDLK